MENFIKEHDYAILVYAKEDDLAIVMERDNGSGQYSIRIMS